MSGATIRESLIASGQLQPDAPEEEVFQGILFGRHGRPQVGPMQNTFKTADKKNEGSKKPTAKKKEKAMTTTSRTTESKSTTTENEATAQVLRGLDEATVSSRRLSDRLHAAERARRIDNERELASNAGLLVGGIGGALVAKYGMKMGTRDVVTTSVISGVVASTVASIAHTTVTAIINKPKKAKPVAAPVEEPKAQN